jgi:hypothetical protein
MGLLENLLRARANEGIAFWGAMNDCDGSHGVFDLFIAQRVVPLAVLVVNVRVAGRHDVWTVVLSLPKALTSVRRAAPTPAISAGSAKFL